MTFYRVRYLIEGGNSAGFSWHTSYRDAMTTALHDYDEHPSEYNQTGATRMESVVARIDIIEIDPSKKGILEALKQFASHPDNG